MSKKRLHVSPPLGMKRVYVRNNQAHIELLSVTYIFQNMFLFYHYYAFNAITIMGERYDLPKR